MPHPQEQKTHCAFEEYIHQDKQSGVRSGYTKPWKKAIVKLDPEHRIEFF